MAFIPEGVMIFLFPRFPGWESVWTLSACFRSQNHGASTEFFADQFAKGRIEVLPMPIIVPSVHRLSPWVHFPPMVEPKKVGTVLFTSPRFWKGKDKDWEPDIVFKFAKNPAEVEDHYYQVVDLMGTEVVNGHSDGRERGDTNQPVDYAERGILGNSIFEPMKKPIEMLINQGQQKIE